MGAQSQCPSCRCRRRRVQSNRLESMKGFEACTALEELYLSHNGIWHIEVSAAAAAQRGSGGAARQRRSAAAPRPLALLAPRRLVLLHAHTVAVDPQGLETLTNLKILDVSSNRLTKIQGLDTLTQLEDLWLNDNGAPPCVCLQRARPRACVLAPLQGGCACRARGVSLAALLRAQPSPPLTTATWRRGSSPSRPPSPSSTWSATQR